MELYPEYAPNTVANFIKLVESGYYNDKVFYGRDDVCIYVGRTADGEVTNPTANFITGNAEETYEYTIKGEFVANGFEQNTLRHEKGVISLIRNDYSQYFSELYEESYNSGNAQIGIMMGDKAANLNGVYAAFGKITEGLEIVEKLYNEAEVVAIPEETTATTETTDTTNTTTTTENTTSTETTNTAENTVTESAETEDATEDDADGIYEFATYPKIVSASVDTHGVTFESPVIEEAFDYETYINDYMSSYYSTSTTN